MEISASGYTKAMQKDDELLHPEGPEGAEGQSEDDEDDEDPEEGPSEPVDLGTEEAAIEKPPCRGGMEDQEPSASYRQPKDTTNREDAGRAAVEDVNYEQQAASICSKLLQRAMASGSRENISVMVILLQGLEVLGVQSEDALSQSAPLWCGSLSNENQHCAGVDLKHRTALCYV